ncbi:G8 domain-containing protein [Adhaeretor mobilis]|uniref:Bifunctional hemolysin/adenylate cyclase n=1 Tax=Adhaeretor mobilis TaxID=1930276 RepID=A0A517N1Y3_9BACT|nr:G8 domain-containing protein [Adhaeretor mobilis]QDT01147.1 Bifunctional hemolysin/adenylate cyclase precursor [Adhaeretor mobilis]
MARLTTLLQSILNLLGLRSPRSATSLPDSKRSLDIETLEERRLLSTNQLYWNPVNSKITIIGSELADTAVVSEAVAGEIHVSYQLAGEELKATFDKAVVSSIVFYGKGGDDSFSNSTDLSVVAFGDLGNDTLQGGSANDRLYGGLGADRLLGGSGDDSLYGAEGNDELHGEEGDDYLLAGSGDDILLGHDGVDSLIGGSGNDHLEGGQGSDRMWGSEGSDVLLGNEGVDLLFGEAGEDTLFGGSENDELRGGTDDDHLYGGKGADYLAGESGEDLLSGDDGNDALYGGSGDDQLAGGEGNDILYGSTGDDKLFGDNGEDRLYGELGSDELSGGIGNDQLKGGEGNDYLIGEAGDDYLSGAEGNDVLYGHAGNDTLVAGAGDDKLVGFEGDDLLYGNAGDDRIFGNEGKDRLYGDTGHDTLIGAGDDDHLEGGEGNDYLAGGEGNDYLVGGDGDDGLYGHAGNDSLYAGPGNDKLVGYEGDDLLYGSVGDDLLLGDAGKDRLFGEAGHDTLIGAGDDDHLEGGEGNDYLAGGEGNDYLVGGDGDDGLYGHAGNDSLYAGPGNDKLVGYEGDDLLYGSVGDDLLLGDAGKDRLFGEAGRDRLIGAEDDDYLVGGEDNDYLAGGEGDDYLVGGDGDDSLYGHAGNDSLYAGPGNDKLVGYEGDDLLHGNAGDDTLFGNEDDDRLYGEEGRDALGGGAGNDMLVGGEDDDTLYGNQGDDVLNGSAGNDLLQGDAGQDQLRGGTGQDSLAGGLGNDDLRGGEGNDLLIGDQGHDLLDGEEGDDLLSGGQGNDELLGGAGKDVLIGGTGLDKLTGSAGEDLLVGSDVAHDLAALNGLQQQWADSSPYESRIAAIQSAGSANALQLQVNVLDDHVADEILGGGDRDWIVLPGILPIYDPLASTSGHSHSAHDHSTTPGGHHHYSTESIVDYVPVVEGFALIDSLDHLRDIAPDESLHTLIPHARDASKQEEHLSLFELVRYDEVTHTALADGDWSDSSIWEDGVAPQPGARVLIPVGVEVQVDQVIGAELETVRVDGTLSFATDEDTQLKVDTMIVSEVGRLEIGTADTPIFHDVTAQLTFTDRGAIDRSWDPYGISRGLITHGSVEIHGAETTSHLLTSGALAAGATTLQLESVPTGWNLGDQIVIAGTSSEADESEQRTITAIVGSTIAFAPLDFDHALPTPSGQVHVANLTRNIVISSDADEIARRGHVMFMHNRDVNVSYATFDKLGRTNKLISVNDSEVDENWDLVAGTGTNNRARYAIHFHRNGTVADSAPAVVHGSVVTDNAGWGYVNHSSYVNFTENVAYDVTGAAFTTEVGDEIGSFARNIAISTSGTGEDPDSRQRLQDFGHGGDGFWFQGAGISVVDNVASGSQGSAFFFYTRGFGFGGQRAHFPTASLVDPSIADGQNSILADHVPVVAFHGNQGYSSAAGLTVRYHLRDATHDVQSVFSDSQFYNNTVGVNLPYTNQTVLRNLTIVNDVGKFEDTGVQSNFVTKSIVYDSLHVAGYYHGIRVARGGDSVVNNGYFEAITAIHIKPAASENRKIVIQGSPIFAKPAPELLGNINQHEVVVGFSVVANHGSISHLFASNSVTLNYGSFDNQRVYFNTQLPNAIPFPESAAHIPEEYIGLTTAQLRTNFGKTIAGEIAPDDTVTLPQILGVVGLPGA